MLRTLFLSAVLAATTVSGLGLTAAPATAAPLYDHHHPTRFAVLVLHHGHWDGRGTYRDRDDARRAANHLRRHGLTVRVVPERAW